VSAAAAVPSGALGLTGDTSPHRDCALTGGAGGSGRHTGVCVTPGSRISQSPKKATAIEQGRLHASLTPKIELTCEARDRSGSLAELTLELTGPAGLDRLDEVRVRIRDDKPREPTPGSLQQEQNWEQVIWGPYRIKSGLRDTDTYGRQHGPFPLPKNEPYPIPLEQSYAPSWSQ
jgi:hypothetical protein